MRKTLTWIVLGLAGCATSRADLDRGQRFYEEAQYERALAIWRVLEQEADSLNILDRTRYAYLRGMTDYRLGFHREARHWLALAKAYEELHPGALNQEWRERLEEALTGSSGNRE